MTGATGFVGTAVLDQLLHSQRFVARAAVRGGGRTLPPGIECVAVGDVDATTVWEPALRDVQAIVHLAARVHVMRDRAVDPLAEFRHTNLAGTLRLAGEAVAAGTRRFVFISSIKVNGEDTTWRKPYTADDIPAPLDPYGISKLEAENALRQLARQTGMELVIVRPPLVYGPHVKGNFLRLLKWVERGIPLPFANVDNRRSLISVRNLAHFVVRSIEHPAAAGETFLISDGEDLSTRDLIERLAGAMARTPHLFPVPLSVTRSAFQLLRRGDLWQRLFGSLQVNSEKARSVLAWTPPVSADEGLAEVGRWYVENKKKG